MIYEGLLVPHEAPPTLREIKRALITYDKTILTDPNDRDVIPATSFESVLGIPFFGINIGPIRPLGKVQEYDSIFDLTWTACRPAVEQGLLEVRSTYVQEEHAAAYFGMPPLGGYPLPPPAVFRLFCDIASRQEFLRCAIPDIHDLCLALPENPDLALGGRSDTTVNDVPIFSEPLRIDQPSTEALRLQLERISRARIASFVKYAGYCEAKSLVPSFPSIPYGGILQQVVTANREALLLNDDPFWLRRSRMLGLCNEEYLSNERIDALSIEDVIKLRTQAWGRQATAREQMFESVFTIAAEVADEAEFEEKATEIIRQYHEESEDLARERSAFNWKTRCKLGEGMLGGAAGALGIPQIGTILQVGIPTAAIGVALLAAGAWAVKQLEALLPIYNDLRVKEEAMKRGASMGLHNFYSKI